MSSNSSDMTTTPIDADASPHYGFGRTLAVGFEAGVMRVTEALSTEGFGVLTTIDVQATMKAKLDVDIAPYTILGACNPSLAHRALTADPNIGLLLPCNVVVRALPTQAGQPQTHIEIVDPLSMLTIVPDHDIASVAQAAQERLKRVLTALG